MYFLAFPEIIIWGLIFTLGIVVLGLVFFGLGLIMAGVDWVYRKLTGKE